MEKDYNIELLEIKKEGLKNDQWIIDQKKNIRDILTKIDYWKDPSSGSKGVRQSWVTRYTKDLAVAQTALSNYSAENRKYIDDQLTTLPQIMGMYQTYGRTVSEEIKRVTDPILEQIRINEQFRAEQEELTAIFDKLAEGERYIARMTQLLGKDFDTAKEKISLYNSILKELAKTTIPLSDSRMRALAKAVGLVNEAVRAIPQVDIMKALGFGDKLVKGPIMPAIDFDVETIKALQIELGQIALKNAWMGDTFDDVGAQARALENAIDALNAAYPEGNAPIEDLVDQYNSLIAIQEKVETISKRLARTLGNTMGELANSLGQAFAGTEGAYASMVDTILSGAKQIINVLLAEAVAAMIAKESHKGLLGLLTAAVGIGLLTALWNSRKSSMKMERGGIIPPGYPNDSYPAMLTSGERVIPAAPIPLGLSGGQGGKVIFRIHKDELIGILEKANNQDTLF